MAIVLNVADSMADRLEEISQVFNLKKTDRQTVAEMDRKNRKYSDVRTSKLRSIWGEFYHPNSTQKDTRTITVPFQARTHTHTNRHSHDKAMCLNVIAGLSPA